MTELEDDMKNCKQLYRVTGSLELKNKLAKITTILELGKTPAGVETNDQALYYRGSN